MYSCVWFIQTHHVAHFFSYYVCYSLQLFFLSEKFTYLLSWGTCFCGPPILNWNRSSWSDWCLFSLLILWTFSSHFLLCNSYSTTPSHTSNKDTFRENHLEERCWLSKQHLLSCIHTFKNKEDKLTVASFSLRIRAAFDFFRDLLGRVWDKPLEQEGPKKAGKV